MVALLCACGDGSDTPTKNDAAEVYSAIIGQLLADRAATTTTVKSTAKDHISVFVEALGDGYVIDLSVQAGVVKSLEPVALVRFIDNRAEAIERNEPGKPVRNDGMLVALGPLVDASSAQRKVLVRRYVDDNRHEDLLATVNASGASWAVVLSAQ